tara:strand:- start:1907 stop:3748 length:1842 start_codon:yes stop_codon:yes gene_type:complete
VNSIILYTLILVSLLLSNQSLGNPQNINKIDYKSLFKQASSLERNGLFDEAQIIYLNILSTDPINRAAFNKIKNILRNKENFDLLKDIGQKYQEKQPKNLMAKIDLMEIYIWASDKQWINIKDEIVSDNLSNDFIIRVLLNKMSYSNLYDSMKEIISLKRKEKNKESYFSFEMGNYYISNLQYEEAIYEFLIFLDKNPDQYNKISNKIISISDYPEIQNNIKTIFSQSTKQSSKLLLSDIEFKSKNFDVSYNLLKESYSSPEQLLDFAYQAKKIKNYDLAIKVYNDIINSYSSKIVISAILNMADALEQKSMESNMELDLSKYFFNNKILSSPYYYVDKQNLNNINQAISIYDSLYTISKGSDAGFRLADIKFKVLNDLDTAFKIYNDCIKYSKNQNIQFKSNLRVVDLMIAKGSLSEAQEIVKSCMMKFKKEDFLNILKIKNIQIDFLSREPFIDDSLSKILLLTDKNDSIYNDLLDIKSLIISFNDNPEMLKIFSEIQLFVFQNKRTQAINKFIETYESGINNNMIKDIFISHLSYLLILQKEYDLAVNYLNMLSYETIYSEFGHILKAELFDFILNDKKSAVDIYLNFLDQYPTSIFYDDIRIRLRELAS